MSLKQFKHVRTESDDFTVTTSPRWLSDDFAPDADFKFGLS